MQRTPYPYCKHGVYVGGCGVDYMCHECEMGDPTPTPAQLEAEASSASQYLDARIAEVEAIQEKHGIHLTPRMILHLTRDARLRYQNAKLHLAFALQWAKGPHDDRWLDRHRDHLAKEWEAMSGEDQFNSLPDYVLDGP